MCGCTFKLLDNCLRCVAAALHRDLSNAGQLLSVHSSRQGKITHHVDVRVARDRQIGIHPDSPSLVSLRSRAGCQPGSEI